VTEFTAIIKEKERERAVHNLRKRVLVDFDVTHISDLAPGEITVIFSAADSHEIQVKNALVRWFAKDHTTPAPFPFGTLLFWHER
jgi:hypothetical protein